MSSKLKRLGRYVLARRESLGLTQGQVAERGGPSDTTLTKIENGTGPLPSKVTLKRLDKALEWEPGGAHQILEGGEPGIARPVTSRDVGIDPELNRQDDAPPESYSNRILREAEESQAAFEKSVDDMLAAEAAADRANQLAFRVILIHDRMSEGVDARAADRLVTSTDIAELVSVHATVDAHEWTRYEMAIVERFDPEYVEHSGDLASFSRFMDMTAARKRASRTPLPTTDEA